MATRVRVGIESARELELELEDPDAFITDLQSALEAEATMLWVTDSEGKRHGVIVSRVAFVEVGPEKSNIGVGFAGGS